MARQINPDDIQITPLKPAHFDDVVRLGNLVHGEGYLNNNSIANIAAKGLKNDVNCSFVAYYQGDIVGFRLTYAPGNWQLDQWCSVNDWPVSADKTCYFKCSTVAESMRGAGLGGTLLKVSIDAAKHQGALAGLAHIWRQSPNNSAFMYFSRCGGELIKDHPDKWLEDSKNGYECVICGIPCHCTAAEMLIDFDQPRYA